MRNKFKKIQYIQHHINPWGEDFGARVCSVSYTDRVVFEIGKVYEVDCNKNSIFMTTDIHVNDVLIDKAQFRYVIEYNAVNELLYPEFEKVKIRGKYWLADKLPELYDMSNEDYTSSIQLWSTRKYPPKKI